MLDLFCASLTTICELVLPLIMRYITVTRFLQIWHFTLNTIFRLNNALFSITCSGFCSPVLYGLCRHVMGARIETDMRKDAYAHLQKLSYTYYNNTKLVKSWVELPMICLTLQNLHIIARKSF